MSQHYSSNPKSANMKLECNVFAGSARILNEETVMDVISEHAKEPGQEDPFYVLDVGDIVQKIMVWRLKLPRVKPFYAVKCNDHPTVLAVLATLGIGFDCASKAEIKKILQLGVDQSRIIYAHPCKPVSHLRQAAKLQIPLMTFDNETELHKVKACYPQAKLVIRIRCDAADAEILLGNKFGVLPEGAGALLATARDLNLNIVGVAFHVGSGCREPAVFYRAIAAAENVFEEAVALGFNPYLLDIGGGFPGTSNSCFDELVDYVNKALDDYFPEGCGVEIIAEPGRYVVASAFTLATNIIAKREVTDNSGSLVSIMYYTNDGVHGSFKDCMMYEPQGVSPVVLKDHDDEPYLPCSIWGPTCDSKDLVRSEIKLPRLACGEWLVWPEMGAYTLVLGGTFNGFPLPKVIVVVPHHTWLYLEEHLGNTVPITSSGAKSGVRCAPQDLHEEGPATLSAAPHYTCAANSTDPGTLEDRVAQLTFVGVHKM